MSCQKREKEQLAVIFSARTLFLCHACLTGLVLECFTMKTEWILFMQNILIIQRQGRELFIL